VERGIEQKIVDLNAHIVLVRMDTKKNIARRKMEKDLFASVNYLEVLVNDEKATLVELNRLCGVNNNIFFLNKNIKKEKSNGCALG
jgi:hypothetical protein